MHGQCIALDVQGDGAGGQGDGVCQQHALPFMLQGGMNGHDCGFFALAQEYTARRYKVCLHNFQKQSAAIQDNARQAAQKGDFLFHAPVHKRAAEEKRSVAAKLAYKIYNNYESALATILIGNNIVNVAAASLTTTLAYHFGGSYVAIASGIITILILLFGEITPKTLATIHADKISLFYAPIIDLFMKLMTPFIFIINGLSTVILMILRVNPNDKNRAMTENELRTIVDVSHEDGVIEEEEKEIMINLIKESLKYRYKLI